MVGGGILPRGPEFPNTPRGMRTAIAEKASDEYNYSDYVKASTPQRVPPVGVEASAVQYLNQALVNCRPPFSSRGPYTPRTNASEFRLNPTAIDLKLSRERCPAVRCPEAQSFGSSTLHSILHPVADVTITSVATQVKSPRFEPHRLSLASDLRLVTLYVSPAHKSLCAKLPTFDHIHASGYGPSPRRHQAKSARDDASESLLEIGQFEERLVALNSERREARAGTGK
jgi:hypothetical protein